eukprot:2267458-Rhodomonas_salina.3
MRAAVFRVQSVLQRRLIAFNSGRCLPPRYMAPEALLGMLLHYLLRTCDVVSGTDIAYGTSRKCASDAVCGTEIAYGVTRVLDAICLRACYAMPGTGIAYATCLRACYAVSGTDIG